MLQCVLQCVLQFLYCTGFFWCVKYRALLRKESLEGFKQCVAVCVAMCVAGCVVLQCVFQCVLQCVLHFLVYMYARASDIHVYDAV